MVGFGARLRGYRGGQIRYRPLIDTEKGVTLSYVHGCCAFSVLRPLFIGPRSGNVCGGGLAEMSVLYVIVDSFFFSLLLPFSGWALAYMQGASFTSATVPRCLWPAADAKIRAQWPLDAARL